MAPNLRNVVTHEADYESSFAIAHVGAHLCLKESESSPRVGWYHSTSQPQRSNDETDLYWDWSADTTKKNALVVVKEHDLFSSDRMVANLIKDAVAVSSSGTVGEHDDYWKEESAAATTTTITSVEASIPRSGEFSDGNDANNVHRSCVHSGTYPFTGITCAGGFHSRTTIDSCHAYWDESSHQITPSDRYWNMVTL